MGRELVCHLSSLKPQKWEFQKGTAADWRGGQDGQLSKGLSDYVGTFWGENFSCYSPDASKTPFSLCSRRILFSTQSQAAFYKVLSHAWSR